MTATVNRQVVLARRPTGLPVPADFALRHGTVPRPGEGELLVRTLLLSIDPAMRGWVLDVANYVEPVPVGGVMRSFGLGEVVESRSDRYRPGDVVLGLPGWQEWAVLAEDDVQRRIDPTVAPLSTALGVLGINGLTAYVGTIDIGRAGPSDTVLVSSAAGAVGSAAGQLARLHGARVVGLTGSEEKRRRCLDEFGFDACIDYRATDDLEAAIGAACPDGVDVYFDSVGGAMLDAALAHVTVGARVAICGTIGLPAGRPADGPRVERRLLVQRVLMQGFLATDHLDRADEIAGRLAAWIASGELRYREEIAPVLDDAPESLARVLDGRNAGKSLVRVADPSPFITHHHEEYP